MTIHFGRPFDLDRFIVHERPDLVRYVVLVLGHGADAERIATETMLHMQAAADQFEVEIRARTWCEVTATSIAMQDDAVSVAELMHTLDEQQRTALLLRAEGQDDETIGAALGLHPRLVPGLLRLAREALAPLRGQW